jgi:hypothetical protein
VAISGYNAWKDHYRTWLLVDVDAAPSTVDEYRYVIWDFLAFLGDKPWQRATKHDLGHKDSRTTRIYVARYPWNLEEAVDLIPDPCQFQKEWRP